MKRDDYVDVKLTKRGEELAGEHELHVASGSYEYTFRAGQAQRVTRFYDWNVVLKKEKFEGEHLFELAETPAADKPGPENTGTTD